MLFPLGAWCPSLGKGGERERRTGTKLMAEFLLHICSRVNTSKGVVFSLIAIDILDRADTLFKGSVVYWKGNR